MSSSTIATNVIETDASIRSTEVDIQHHDVPNHDPDLDTATLPSAHDCPEDSSQKTITTCNSVREHQIITKDFGFLPIPAHLQYHPDKPHDWTLALNVFFGIAATFLVANLYYCQPILIQLAESFGVTYDEVSRIPTLIQAGYAVGLLLISPLGDLVRRRPLILLLTFLSASLSIGIPLVKSVAAFEAISFLVGIVTVVPQIMMPFAADLAPPARRASAISIVLSGLLFGILLARVLSGIISEYASWRVVYYLAIGLQFTILFTMWIVLPDYPRRNDGLTYWGILYSMAKYAVTEPLLIQTVLVDMASMAMFSSFWVTLTFLLSGFPYNYNTLVIGLFGLVGMGGVAMAPLVGRVADKLHPWFAATVSCFILILFQAIQTGAGGINIAAVIIVCFGIDVFRQMQQIFLGQVMGSSVGTQVFLKHGWRAAALVSLAWCGFCLFVMLIRGPNVGRYTWFGYEGGYEVRKNRSTVADPIQEKSSDVDSEGGAVAVKAC
ncbi:hypothetical protein EUX98_g7177 [Antrodiella citrinella]|uniref:Major facilitator superfamily (MFS) profile domain-containing protein n=1 Tax=Antrodiella citrinella TaxID=2447956 RepID=A0A4S4MUJ9_9APHY|nr:hypothetical protein EUX98_g7177 [Antrodiella citrinella]